MKWILLVIYITGPNSPEIRSWEFETKAACEAAATFISNNTDHQVSCIQDDEGKDA